MREFEIGIILPACRTAARFSGTAHRMLRLLLLLLRLLLRVSPRNSNNSLCSAAACASRASRLMTAPSGVRRGGKRMLGCRPDPLAACCCAAAAGSGAAAAAAAGAPIAAAPAPSAMHAITCPTPTFSSSFTCRHRGQFPSASVQGALLGAGRGRARCRPTPPCQPRRHSPGWPPRCLPAASARQW